MPVAKTLLVLAGPTAIGKTAMAIRLAKHFDTEIISADSRQFYREMSIGTAKPSPVVISAAKHHFIDSLSIHDAYSVGEFEEQSLAKLESIFSTKDIAILVGGSGLFIDAVTKGFDKLPKASAEIRTQLNDLYASKGISALQIELQRVDPVYFEEADLNNPQRIVRALEVFYSSGQPFSSYRTNRPAVRDFNTIGIVLNTDREALYKRINTRVDTMVQEGLVDEARRLETLKQLNALKTVGYSELFDHFDGKITLTDAIEQIKQNTRRFAKRQLTWFRKDATYKWFEPDEFDGIIGYIEPKLKG